ncbi:hypothetical protein FAUST_9608 [Fusarium austroamericanum]|uniref:Uncharacterized protein n=1 Tax=Fusarium austroamericanum TaxID=282268 RepID=A0AAN5Z2V4_FUSAU|nr:hypothetical protein FAUST_9608 [Fusarium austroamericanum]
MSGLDVGVSILTLLQAAISLTKKIDKSYKQQKNLPEVCDWLRRRLATIKTIVTLIQEELELQTPSVVKQLVKFERASVRIKKTLESINPLNNSPVRVFLHQVISGSEDEKRITEIIDDLEGEKSSLILVIQVAGIGLRKNALENLAFVPNASAKRIDKFLRDKLEVKSGLKLMRIMEDRAEDGNANLTQQDMQSMLSAMQPPDRGGNSDTERIIIDNVAMFPATQINAPLGEDIWAKIAKIVIERNVAERWSTQINYPMRIYAFLYAIVPQLAFLFFLSFIFYFPLQHYFK